jgi:hypothetical protein
MFCDETGKRDGPLFGACPTEKVCIMPETMEQIQQMKRVIIQQQRVVNDEALTILAADFAQLSLSIQPTHERSRCS